MCAIVDILLILIVILFILLLWRGPSMLPQLGEALGKAVKGVRENVDADAGKRDDRSAVTARADSSSGSARDGGSATATDQDAADNERGA